MHRETKKILGTAAVVAWLFVCVAVIIAMSWLWYQSIWAFFGVGALLAAAYFGMMLAAAWADRA